MKVNLSWFLIVSFLVIFVSANSFGDNPSIPRVNRTVNDEHVFVSQFAALAPFYDVYLGRNILEDKGTHPHMDSIYFLLYKSREAVREFHIRDKDHLLKVGFNKNAPTKIFCHGYMSDYSNRPANLLRRAYFKATKSVNLFVVNWAKMASLEETRPTSDTRKFPNILYIPPANNTEIVGNKTADLIVFLVKKVGVHLSKIHLIGHGFGAHAMGYAGLAVQSRLKKKVSRITALDPAAPCFETFVRVCFPGRYRVIEKTDAQFVDAIHTHGKALGMMRPVGHADFYPNGGYVQPRCSTFNLGVCSHHRAVELMADSIMLARTKKGKSHLRAHNCSSWENYEQHFCDGSSATLGEFCSVRARGKYFLQI